jgi:hypothetical protein
LGRVKSAEKVIGRLREGFKKERTA